MREWLQQVSREQLEEWMAYERVEPWAFADSESDDQKGEQQPLPAREAMHRMMRALGFNTQTASTAR